ncbi:MAG: hypothetical protein A4E53_00131 [Pelotomaculum sp. PtaB.Bin104]|nr:MAG: hypothetical protein A4E53_00131 [Pelotomaculum sp. PtaB.Bin104]
MKELAKTDPMGEKWTAIQEDGSDQRGREYLTEQGYKGSIYSFEGYAGTVPMLISTDKDGQTHSTHDVSQMNLEK